ncbi:MAG: histidine phosphatase family protein [Planctomycetes bacterium]|nr:histidine phosphatase family protein [Planctomycetota bacterium]
MKLYLVRHGRAVHPMLDPTEPLSEEGRREVRTLAARLLAAAAAPAWIAHSPRARAVETARILGEVLAPGVSPVVREDLLPHGAPDDLVAELAREERDALLVAHMPLLGDLVRGLLGPPAKEHLFFPTAGALCLERTSGGAFEVRWSAQP